MRRLSHIQFSGTKWRKAVEQMVMAPAIINVRIRSRLEEDKVEETSGLVTMPEPFNHVVPLSAINELNTLVQSVDFQDYQYAPYAWTVVSAIASGATCDCSASISEPRG